MADDPLQAMAEYVIPSPGKNHPLVNMRSVAFNLPEAVKSLIKNKSYVDLTTLTKSKTTEPSSLYKTVATNSTTFTLTDYVCPPSPPLSYLDWYSVYLTL